MSMFSQTIPYQPRNTFLKYRAMIKITFSACSPFPKSKLKKKNISTDIFRRKFVFFQS